MTERAGFWDGRELVTTYVYTDADGRAVFRVRRFRTDPAKWGRPKLFDFQHPHPRNFLWRPGKPDNAGAYLYRLPEATGALIVHWAEGEKDADALRGAGVVATSHHGGAGHATVEQAQLLRRAGRVYIWADLDAAGAYCGGRRAALLVAAGVPAERVAVVRARAGHDASDHLRAGYGPSEAVPVDLGAMTALASTYDRSRGGGGYRPVDAEGADAIANWAPVNVEKAYGE